MSIKRTLSLLCSFFLALHFKTSVLEGWKDRMDVVNIFHSVVDRVVYFGVGIALGIGSLLVNLCSLIPSIDSRDCRFLGDLCFCSAKIALHQMVEAPSSWVRSPQGGWIPKTHFSWYEHQFRLAKIPRTTEEEAAFLSFLEKRWLAKANGFFPSEVNVMAPCFGVTVQVSPVTRNSYARDPFSHFSKVYEQRMNAWKKSLPHPFSYPLILTRPFDLCGYLKTNPGRRIVDLTQAFPKEEMRPEEWLQLWEMHQAHLHKQCKELDISPETLLCIQRVEQNGIGGLRLLPLEGGKSVEEDYALLLAWISTAGLTANLVELDRLPDVHRPLHSESLQKHLNSDPFLQSVRGEMDGSFMIRGMLSILEALAQRIEKKVLSPTYFAVLQMSLDNIAMHLDALRKQGNRSFFKTADLIEQVYLNVLPLLEIFSPFDFEDFAAAYGRILDVPKTLKPLSSYSLFASGMTGLSGIFQAVQKISGKTPRVIYGSNTYFECIRLATQVSEALLEEDATQEDWEAADLLLLQFNPVLRRDNPQHLEYRVEKISENIRKSLGKQRHKRLTVALDATIDFLDSQRIKEVLVEFAPEIEEGILNIVCYRSGLKFDLFGMDNYSGAPYFAIHAKDPYWAPFDALLEDPALKTDSLSLQWFCLAFESAHRELDLYRRQIFQNTRELLRRVPQALFDPHMRYRIVPMAEEVDPSFVDIKVSGPFHKIRAAAIVGGCLYLRSMQEGFPIFYRRSFGFYHPNFGILFAEDCSTIRLTLGLDPAQIDTYVRCIQEIHQLNF